MSDPFSDSDNGASGIIASVIIVGGGTAGWLAASHLAKKLNSKSRGGVKVTLIESPDIPAIGVGEGTVPAIRKTLMEFGISEKELLAECEATFKQSVKFVNWRRAPIDGASEYYHHVFDYPVFQNLNLTPYWLMDGIQNSSYAHAVSVQAHLCDAGMGPKLPRQNEYEGFATYAYHLDATKFSNILSKNAREKFGVNHINAKIVDVVLDDSGNIAAVVTDKGEQLEADFFVDCTGFRSLLLGGKLGVPFKDRGDVLLTDHAIALQSPYSTPDQPIACHTIATAKDAGWIWDISLQSRRGLGYVYSSLHTDHQTAEDVLWQYLDDVPEHIKRDLQPRRIKMNIGYREIFWHKNCVAIGLSQGFVEPLEATGLLMYDAMSRFLADMFPGNVGELEASRKVFNRIVGESWDRVIDFIKLHYCLTERTDTKFWRDNRDPAHIPDTLLEKLERWKFRAPDDYDFDRKFDIFNQFNYAYVLYGMKYGTDLSSKTNRFGQGAHAQKQAREFADFVRAAGDRLLPHRDLIDHLKIR